MSRYLGDKLISGTLPDDIEVGSVTTTDLTAYNIEPGTATRSLTFILPQVFSQPGTTQQSWVLLNGTAVNMGFAPGPSGVLEGDETSILTDLIYRSPGNADNTWLPTLYTITAGTETFTLDIDAFGANTDTGNEFTFANIQGGTSELFHVDDRSTGATFANAIIDFLNTNAVGVIPVTVNIDYTTLTPIIRLNDLPTVQQNPNTLWNNGGLLAVSPLPTVLSFTETTRTDRTYTLRGRLGYTLDNRGGETINLFDATTPDNPPSFFYFVIFPPDGALVLPTSAGSIQLPQADAGYIEQLVDPNDPTITSTIGSSSSDDGGLRVFEFVGGYYTIGGESPTDSSFDFARDTVTSAVDTEIRLTSRDNEDSITTPVALKSLSVNTGDLIMTGCIDIVTDFGAIETGSGNSLIDAWTMDLGDLAVRRGNDFAFVGTIVNPTSDTWVIGDMMYFPNFPDWGVKTVTSLSIFGNGFILRFAFTINPVSIPQGAVIAKATGTTFFHHDPTTVLIAERPLFRTDSDAVQMTNLPTTAPTADGQLYTQTGTQLGITGAGATLKFIIQT